MDVKAAARRTVSAVNEWWRQQRKLEEADEFGSMPSTPPPLNTADVCVVVEDATRVFAEQPMLLEVDSPIRVIGSVYGQLDDLMRFFDVGGHPPASNYLFLGNYGSAGGFGPETLALLLAYKVLYPENFFMLRGHHEDELMMRIHGLKDAFENRSTLGEAADEKWTSVGALVGKAFGFMPVGCVIGEQILCVCGGISDKCDKSVKDTGALPRPQNGITSDKVPQLLTDLVCSQPEESEEWVKPLDKDYGCAFGEAFVKTFLEKNDLGLLVTTKLVAEHGHFFFGGRRLVNVFSAPCYRDEYDNDGAMMSIDEMLCVSFSTLKKS